MTFANEFVTTASRVLGKCCSEVAPAGPWRWRCLVQNGALLPLTATIDEGFLHLAGQVAARETFASTLDRALRLNASLAGGVKFALNAASGGLHACADVVLMDEMHMLERLRWAIEGFHQAGSQLNAPDSGGGCAPGKAASTGHLAEILRESAWSFTERGANELVANLEADSAPVARISLNDLGVTFTLDLLCCAQTAQVAHEALAVFLLTAAGRLRLVRSNAVKEDEAQIKYRFQVCLPAAPAAEEIDHALAALSIASRWVREANVLLDEGAARCYLSARNVPWTQNPENEKEKN
jgi:hypothetical protein